MAGMFYSLKEAAQKLGKTEDQVKQLVKENKLREFRDGSNLLFKIEEVNALLAEGVGAEDLTLEELPAEEPAAEAVGETLDEDIFKLEDEAAPVGTGDEAADLDLLVGLTEDTPVEGEPAAEGSGEGTAELAAEEPQAEATQPAEEDLFLAEDLEQPAAEEAPLSLGDTAEGSSEEISLASETGTASGSDITDMDTALTGQGINVLGGTDTDYKVTDDSMAETAGPAAAAGTGAEASLEEIEDDVNLDSFGSGSGLLDLSLQADDTSLGGILDEIYTSEGGEGDATPAEGEPAEAAAEEGGEVGEAASFDDITSEAERAPAEEEVAVPEAVAVMPTAVAAAYVEAAPDSQSNVFGMLLFVPLAVLLYTAIAAVAALQGVTPGIVASLKSMIWLIMGAGAVVVLLVGAIVPFVVGVERAPKAAKAPKAEKAKKGKPAKEKKGFSLFGKKKEKGAAGPA